MSKKRSTAPAKRAVDRGKARPNSKVNVAPKGGREIVITRTFNAPRELVFDAMSKPAMIKKWLNGPPGWTMMTCKIDLRVGGSYRYVWSNQAGQDMGLSGVYKEVRRPERIVNTEQFEPVWYPGEALSTTMLTEAKGTTLMTVTARYGSRKTRDEILASPMEGGLEFSYQALDALIAAQGKKKVKPGNTLFTGTSEPGTVDAYMKTLKHPLKDVAKHLRSVVLGADKSIGEGISWNAPTFYYTREMKPFDPKTYKRYLVGFNFFKQDVIRLIFLRGAEVKDPKGLLVGDYADGRRLLMIRSMEDLKQKEKDLKRILKESLKKIDAWITRP